MLYKSTTTTIIIVCITLYRLADLIEMEGGVEYMILTHKDDIGDVNCCRC